MLQEGAAQALNDGSKRLAVNDQRIEHAPDVLDRDKVDQHDVSSARIHRDVSGMSSVTEWLRAGVIENSGHIDGLASICREACQRGQVCACFGIAAPEASVTPLNRNVWPSEIFGGHRFE